MPYLVKSERQNISIETTTLDQMDLRKIIDHQYHLVMDHHSIMAQVNEINLHEGTVRLKINEKDYFYKIENELIQVINQLGFTSKNTDIQKNIKAPMPGIVIRVDINIGDTISKGQNLMTIEAMKMENIIKSPLDGVIKEINISSGDKVEKNQILFSFE